MNTLISIIICTYDFTDEKLDQKMIHQKFP